MFFTRDRWSRERNNQGKTVNEVDVTTKEIDLGEEFAFKVENTVSDGTLSQSGHGCCEHGQVVNESGASVNVIHKFWDICDQASWQ